MIDRRTVLIGGLAGGIIPASAGAKPQPNRVARITWPGRSGRSLHGIMAIPGGARGRQPAVLVIGAGGTIDPLVAFLLDRLADAGLVACALDLSANAVPLAGSAALDDAIASVEWLVGNRYVTGRVGTLGVGAGATLVRRLAVAAGGSLTAAVALGGEALPPVPGTRAALLDEPWASIGEATDPEDGSARRADVIARAITFLREHLA